MRRQEKIMHIDGVQEKSDRSSSYDLDRYIKAKNGFKGKQWNHGKINAFYFLFLSEVAGDAHVLPVGVGCEIFTFFLETQQTNRKKKLPLKERKRNHNNDHNI